MSSDPRVHLEQLISFGKGLFCADRAALPTRCALSGASRGEYRRLVLRQLRSGKVRLHTEPQVAATLFAVGKKDSDKQRIIWNGKEISEAALKPPKPPLQANPAALSELEATRDRPLWLSGRDARVFPDQLGAPRGTR